MRRGVHRIPREPRRGPTKLDLKSERNCLEWLRRGCVGCKWAVKGARGVEADERNDLADRRKRTVS